MNTDQPLKVCCLHLKNTEFWEMSIHIRDNGCVNVTKTWRMPSGHADGSKTNSKEKVHSSFHDANKYLEKHKQIKINEGYQERSAESKIDRQISEENEFGKRAAHEDPNSPNATTTKKVHLNPSTKNQQEPSDSMSGDDKKQRPSTSNAVKNQEIRQTNKNSNEKESGAFEFKGSYLVLNSNPVKFFKVNLKGNNVILEEGVVGEADKNIQTKSFDKEKEAKYFALRQVFERLQKGYSPDHKKFQDL